MAIVEFLGQAPQVAQVDTIEIDAYHDDTVYSIGIGQRTISVEGEGSTTLTAEALHALAIAESGAGGSGFAYVTFTVDGQTITATATAPGHPFTIVAEATGGTGTLDHQTVTASEGPDHASSVGNWSSNALPEAGSTIILQNSSQDIRYELESLLNANLIWKQRQTYTGRIGLLHDRFTMADGSYDASFPEYRPTHLQADFARIEIGEHVGTGSPAGSPRTRLYNNRGSASTTIIYRTAAAGENDGLPVDLRYVDDDAVLIVQGPGACLVGVAAAVPGNDSNIARVHISPQARGSRIATGSQCVFKASTGKFEQFAGDSRIESASGTIASIKVHGGTVKTFGTYAVTAADVDGGELVHNATGALTANVSGGVLNGQESNEARTWTVNLSGTGKLLGNESIALTVNEPTAGNYSLQAGS